MDSPLFTQFHVAISVIAIVSGFVVLYGLFHANRMSGVALVFLLTTAATSITGFFFHRDHLLPSHIVGIVALLVMIPTLLALYALHLRGHWRAVYVIGALIGLWFNVFVLIAQAFQKVTPLRDLAPTGSEPPFAVAQGIVFVVFIVITVMALSRSKTMTA